MATKENFSDTYLKRRTVKSDQYTTVVIRDIGHISENIIGVVIDVAEEEFLIECSIDKTWEYSTGFATLLESIDSDVIGKEVDMVFNSDMDKCGFEPDKYVFDIKFVPDKNYSFMDNYSKLDSIHKLLLWSEYKKSESKNKYDVGMEREIESVDNIDASTFNLNIFTNTGSSLSWDIDIPLSTDPESSYVSRFIEEQGGGDPKQLPDLGRAVIVHSTHVDSKLDVISYDNTNEWALINPSNYEKWLKNKNRSVSETPKTRQKTTTQTGKSYRIKRNESFLHVIVHTMTYVFVQNIPDILDLSASEVDILSPMIEIMNIMVTLSLSISMVGLFVYTALNAMKK